MAQGFQRKVRPLWESRDLRRGRRAYPMEDGWRFPYPGDERWSDGEGRSNRRTEEPGQARYRQGRQIRPAKREGVKHTESCGKYGKALGHLPGKASSDNHTGPVPKMDTHGQGENPEVSERTAAKELCKMTP